MASKIFDRYGNELKHTIAARVAENASPFQKLSAALPPGMQQNATAMLSAFATAFTQTTRFIQLQIGDGTEYVEELLPQRIEGHEELSGESRYEVTCLTYNGYIQTEKLEGLAAQIKIATNQPGLDGDPSEIVRCGLITCVDTLPSDGGFAKYRLIVEDPLALLEHRRTSRVFQDMTVKEIIQEVLADHGITKNPAIGSVLEVEFRLRKEYKPRSYCLQYRETDARFIKRLQFEEGMFHRFEHLPGEIPKCRLVIYDDPYSLPEATQGAVRFHRAAATESEDSLTEWTESRRIGPSLTSLRSFDYKPVYTYEANATGTRPIKGPQYGGRNENQDIPAERTLEDYDAPGNYYGKDQSDLDRYAALRQDVHDRQKSSIHAAGNLRQLRVGEWFRLEDHPNYQGLPEQEREFVACVLDFNAHNNLPKGLTDYLIPTNKAEQDIPPYWVNLSLRRRGLSLAPEYAHTQHAKPTANGPQIAIVVGPEGEEVYTDEHGRVKAQLPWARKKEHPECGADLNERSACWMRVVYPSAGMNWGTQYTPRIGQEVLVEFVEGDIDRPLIVGVIHNGRQPPPWFSGAGKLPANRTLSGVKTKEFHGLQYNELIFDDTQGEVRTRLSSEHGATQLNQGFLIHPRTDGKGEPRGDGFELRTDRHGALRAGEGLLLSTEPSTGAAGTQLAREQARVQLEQALQYSLSLSDLAEKQESNPVEIGPKQLAEDGSVQEKVLSGHLDHFVEAVKSWEANTNTDPKSSTATDQAGRQGVLLASGAEGLGLTTPKELIITSGQNLDTVSLRDTQQTTARRWIHQVGRRISLFVAGIANIISFKIQAGKGDVLMHAQSGTVEAVGDENLHLTAVKKRLVASAKEEMLLSCAGAYIRFKGGNIEIHCPGQLSIKCANQSCLGPTSLNEKRPSIVQGRYNEEELHQTKYFSG
jgi:type VI secretion system secreted protein VgrG